MFDRLNRAIAFLPPSPEQLRIVVRERFASDYLAQQNLSKYSIFLAPKLLDRMLSDYTSTRDLKGRVEALLEEVLSGQTAGKYAFPVSVDVAADNDAELRLHRAGSRARQVHYANLTRGRATPEQREQHRLWFPDVAPRSEA